MSKYRLANVELDEISLVDKGANQHAKIAIWKRADMKEKYDDLTPAQRQARKGYMDKGMDEAAA